MIVSRLQQEIINHFQKALPLCSRPYLEIAQALSNQAANYQEQDVLLALAELTEKGVLSRIGPVFDHKKAGASTLAAMAVPSHQLDKIAGIVNQFEQVNHNYAREHQYNLWFVVTAADPMALAKTLEQIEQFTGLSILVLPMEASYHIDLGFKINFDGADISQNLPLIYLANIEKIADFMVDSLPLTARKQRLLRKELELGLPVCARPFQVLASKLSITEQQVITQIKQWQDCELIRRFGLVVKHRKLGFNANAMVVWNIPDDLVDDVAGHLSSFDEVSLCYRRPRRLPDWQYNLFCMIHGKERQVVLDQITQITKQLSNKYQQLVINGQPIEQAVLFSHKAYKQQGARYGQAKKYAVTVEHRSMKTREQAHG